MRTEERVVYTFDELDEDAKEKAREWYRDGALNYEWWDSIVDDAKKIGAMLGIDIDNVYFSGFSSQGDGACFEGSYRYKKGGLAAVKAHAPQDAELHRIATTLQEIQRRNRYQGYAQVRQRGHYNHSGCTHIDVSDVRETDEEAIAQALRDYMDWIYGKLEREYEWLMSDEQVDDNIRANEYEFTENGFIA